MFWEVFFIASMLPHTQILSSNETTSLCNPNPCGPYSKCIDDVNDEFYQKLGTPYCLCLETTVNKPPHCQFHCQKNDTNCPENQFCDVDGKCEAGCRFESCQYSENCDCKPGEPCDCETKGYCSCKSNEYCDKDTGLCKVGCRSDINCRTDEYCDPIVKKCIFGCRSDKSCGLRKNCDEDTRKCVIGCRSDVSCDKGEYCHWSNNCMRGCSEFEDSSCRSEEYCNSVTNTCMKGCRRFSNNCESGKFCDNGVCKIGCKEDEDCKSNEYCFYGACKVGCRTNNDCKIGEYCENLSKKCIIGCDSDSRCKSDEYCSYDKKCKPGCRSDGCKLGEHCDWESKQCESGCADSTNCMSDEFCNDETKKCEKGCQSDNNCKNYQHCDYKSGKCQDVCSESPCGENSICTFHVDKFYCSCKPGYFPENYFGCRPSTLLDQLSFDENGKVKCSIYCGKNASCRVIEGNVYCFCKSKQFDFVNPFKLCQKYSFSYVPFKECDCCGQAIKPHCGVSISAALGATLMTG